MAWTGNHRRDRGRIAVVDRLLRTGRIRLALYYICTRLLRRLSIDLECDAGASHTADERNECDQRNYNHRWNVANR